MANIGNMVIAITATTKGLQAGLNQAEKSVSKSSKVLGTLGKAAGMAAVGGLAAAAVGTAAVAATLPKLIALGSDAEEMMGKFNVVFGEYAEGTISNLDKVAKGMGRSKFEMREFASSFQDTFVPMGFARGEAAELAEQLTELTYDVASFNNSLEPDVARDFQSAIVGNHETVRKYGIVITQAVLEQELMTMGIEGGIKAATEQEKVQARLNLIMAGTSDAHGDAVRTGGSWANQMRALKSTLSDLGTEIGLQLLPVITPLLSKFRELAQEWGPKIADVIGNQVIPKITELAQMLDENKQKWIDLTEAVGVFMGSPLGAFLEHVTWSLGILKSGVEFVSGVLEDLGIKTDKVEGEFSVWKIALDTVGKAITILVGGPFVWIKTALEAIKDLVQTINSLSMSAIISDLERIGGLMPSLGGLGALPGFATGGIVPGPVGAPQLAVVHGGEMVTPAGESTAGANVTLQFSFGGGFSRQEANAAAGMTVDALRTHGVAI